MSNQYYNFSYDPVRQGYDSDTWSTTLGVPVVTNNYLSFTGAGTYHKSEIMRGCITFNAVIATPVSGDNVLLGLKEENSAIFAYFKITDDVLTACTSDGETVKAIPIVWDADWSNRNINFRIKWEVGKVRFFISGQLLAEITEESLLDVSVSSIPNIPMSIIIYNDSSNPLLIKYITATDIQGLA